MSDWERDYERARARQRAGDLRSARMEAARAKGTHTEAAWRALVGVFTGCVRCGVPFAALVGGNPTKDHIRPVAAGGCDCIANLQPVCRGCNSAGIGEDLRPAVDAEWQAKYLEAVAWGAQ